MKHCYFFVYFIEEEVTEEILKDKEELEDEEKTVRKRITKKESES